MRFAARSNCTGCLFVGIPPPVHPRQCPHGPVWRRFLFWGSTIQVRADAAFLPSEIDRRGSDRHKSPATKSPFKTERKTGKLRFLQSSGISLLPRSRCFLANRGISFQNTRENAKSEIPAESRNLTLAAFARFSCQSRNLLSKHTGKHEK